MKNAFDELLRRLHMAEGKKIHKLETTSIETSKIEKQRKERLKNPRIFKNCGTTTEGITCKWNIRRKKQKKKIFLSNNDWEFPKMKTPNQRFRNCGKHLAG